jgi:hypothetical protein
MAVSQLVFVQEADVVLLPDSLSKLCAALADLGVVSASCQTVYNPEKSLLRVLSFLGRERNAGTISNNAALFQADIIRRYPYLKTGSPFVACAERNRRIRKDGHKTTIVASALAIHDFEGLMFELEYYRQKGFQRMAAINKPTPAEIPSLLLQEAKWIHEWIRHRGRTRLSSLERLQAYLLLIPICLAHVPGMLDACNRKQQTGDRFR